MLRSEYLSLSPSCLPVLVVQGRHRRLVLLLELRCGLLLDRAVAFVCCLLRGLFSVLHSLGLGLLNIRHGLLMCGF